MSKNWYEASTDPWRDMDQLTKDVLEILEEAETALSCNEIVRELRTKFPDKYSYANDSSQKKSQNVKSALSKLANLVEIGKRKYRPTAAGPSYITLTYILKSKAPKVIVPKKYKICKERHYLTQKDVWRVYDFDVPSSFFPSLESALKTLKWNGVDPKDVDISKA